MSFRFSPNFCVVCVASLQVRLPTETDNNDAARIAHSRIRPNFENPRYTIEPGTMCPIHEGTHNLWVRHAKRDTLPIHTSESTIGKEKMAEIMKENRKHFQELQRTKGSYSSGGIGNSCCVMM